MENKRKNLKIEDRDRKFNTRKQRENYFRNNTRLFPRTEKQFSRHALFLRRLLKDVLLENEGVIQEI